MTMWVIATFVAFFVKGVCGFANTLVFTSILSYGTANANTAYIGILFVIWFVIYDPIATVNLFQQNDAH